QAEKHFLKAAQRLRPMARSYDRVAKQLSRQRIAKKRRERLEALLAKKKDEIRAALMEMHLGKVFVEDMAEKLRQVHKRLAELESGMAAAKGHEKKHRQAEIARLESDSEMPAAEIREKAAALRDGEAKGMLGLVGEPGSPSTPIGDDGESRLEDLVEDRHSPKPMDQAMDAHLHAQIRKALATLPPRQEKVIRMRFGVGEPRDYTLEE